MKPENKLTKEEVSNYLEELDEMIKPQTGTFYGPFTAWDSQGIKAKQKPLRPKFEGWTVITN